MYLRNQVEGTHGPEEGASGLRRLEKQRWRLKGEGERQMGRPQGDRPALSPRTKLRRERGGDQAALQGDRARWVTRMQQEGSLWDRETASAP